tara:strand:- start:2511 stop:2801 length:291 start_codon:yes stop_codon:yes gene_type:complete
MEQETLKRKLSLMAKSLIIQHQIHKMSDADEWYEKTIKQGTKTIGVFDINIFTLENGKIKAVAYEVINGDTKTDRWLDLDNNWLNEYNESLDIRCF